MLMPDANIASFDASQLNTIVEITADEDFLQVRFHEPTRIVCFARQFRRRGVGTPKGFIADIERSVREAGAILSRPSFERYLADCGFKRVQ